MKQSKEGLTRDLIEFQKLIEQLDPTSTDPDDQFSLRIFTHLIQQRKNSLALLGEEN